MPNCICCNSDYYSAEGKPTCSSPCEDLFDFRRQLETLFLKTKPTDDPRIFFFPLTFGELVDKYCVFCLRRSFTKTIGLQQKIDYRIFKLKRGIETTIAQLAYNKSMRNAFAGGFIELLGIHAQIWRKRDLLRSDKLTSENRLELYEGIAKLDDERLRVVRDLDNIVGHQSTSIRVYDGNDIP